VFPSLLCFGVLLGMEIITDIVLTKLIPSVLAGAGSGISAVLTWVRGVTSRVTELDKRLGKLEIVIGSIETRSGMAKSLHDLERTVHGRADDTGRFDRENTGKWRAVQNQDVDDLWVERRFRDFEDRLSRVESKLKTFVTEDDFDTADRRRADEVQAVRTTLAEIRGLLHGLQSALGLIKSR